MGVYTFIHSILCTLTYSWQSICEHFGMCRAPLSSRYSCPSEADSPAGGQRKKQAQTGRIVHAYNPRAYMPATRGVEAEESQLRGQPGLHSMYQSSLGYRIWPYLPKEKKK